MVSTAATHGNKSVWRQLAFEQPAVAILEGPGGVGKFSGALKFASALTVPDNVLAAQDMTVADARSFGEWLQWRSDAPKIAVLEPGQCHSNVWTILKCLVEELPDQHKVWIVSSFTAPEAVASLGFRYDFSLLTSDDMRAFFEEAQTIAQEADYLTSLGSVDRALKMNRALNVAPAVASWIRAVEESNRRLLITATHTWEQRHTDLLIAELERQAGGKSVINGVQFSRVEKDRLVRALTLLADSPNPQLSAVAVGLSLMIGR